MNIILFHPQERDNDQLTITGERAKHICQILKAEVGDELRCGLLNGPRYLARLTKRQKQQVQLEISSKLPEQPRPVNLDLILALPRPIMLKRILSQVATFGVNNLYLIRSNRVEKSFLSASILQREKMEERLIHGLQQGGHTHLPQVQLFPRFKAFIEETLPSLTKLQGNRLLAHPRVKDDIITAFNHQQSQPTLLAIGPEGGWVDYEINCFQQQGFTPFHMGVHILRVDSAVPALIAQIQLLNQLIGNQRSLA